MIAPAPRLINEIAELMENPSLLAGHNYGIRSYKMAVSELADRLLNVPCHHEDWTKMKSLIAWAFHLWREEAGPEAAEKTSYADWVRNTLRKDIVNKMFLILA